MSGQHLSSIDETQGIAVGMGGLTPHILMGHGNTDVKISSCHPNVFIVATLTLPDKTSGSHFYHPPLNYMRLEYVGIQGCLYLQVVIAPKILKCTLKPMLHLSLINRLVITFMRREIQNRVSCIMNLFTNSSISERWSVGLRLA